MLAVWPLVIAADALAGLGDIRLKDVVLQMTTRHFPLRVLALHYVRMCVIDRDYEEISKMAKSMHRKVADYVVFNMALVKRHRLPLMLYWAAGIEGLSRHRAQDISSALESDFFDISDVPAVLPVVPLLPSAIQTAFKFFKTSSRGPWRIRMTTKRPLTTSTSNSSTERQHAKRRRPIGIVWRPTMSDSERKSPHSRARGAVARMARERRERQASKNSRTEQPLCGSNWDVTA